MRTTITIEDSLYNEIRELSHTRNIPVKTAINIVLATGLQSLSNKAGESDFVQKTYGMGTPHSEYDLIKALEAAGDLEVSEIKRKLDLRK